MTDSSNPTAATPATQRNPYDIALAVLWIIGLAVGSVLLLTGSVLSNSGFREQQENSGGFLQTGAFFAIVGVIFLAAHLASLATRWQTTSIRQRVASDASVNAAHQAIRETPEQYTSAEDLP